ncbi:MAG: DNA alkylation repair protein [Patescibacteria group bacterium]|nr:DNA alkylation repair protein [Patescibacteria group bacterium]
MADFNTLIIKDIKQKFNNYIDVDYRDGERRFFKEKIKNFGVRIPQRRKIAAKFWPEVKKLNKAELFKLADKMFKEGYNEYATVASSWIWHRREEFKPKDWLIFSKWVDKYFDNWAKIDDFSTHGLGYLINQFPTLTKELLKWTKSKNRWVKRAAAVSLIYPFGKKKKYLKEVFLVAENLLTDPDEMVQKGYGWMLKEASKYNQPQVFSFVMKNKDKMPRTALRYAIEKMPEKLKLKAMTRD